MGRVSDGVRIGIASGGVRRLHCVPSHDRAIRAGTRLIYVRWTGLLALFGLEVAALTLRFDTKTLEGGPLWLEGLFGLLRVGFDVVVVGAAVVLLLQRPRLLGVLQCLPDRLQDHPWSRYLFVHLAGLAGFVLLSGPLLEGRPRSAASVVALTICWLGLGLLSLLAWLNCFLPHREWLRLLRRWPWILPAGTVAGLGVLCTGRLAQLLWKPLGVSTLWLVRCILELFSKDVVFQPAERIIGTTAFDVEIAPACSGYEGMGLMLVLIGAFLMISKNSEAAAGAVAAAAGLPPGVPRQRGADRRVDLAGDPCLRRNRTGGLPLSGRFAALPGRRIRADRPVITIAYVLGRRQAGQGGRRYNRLRGLPLPLDGTGRHHAGDRRVRLWIRSALSSGPDRDVRTVWRFRKYYDDLCWTFAPQAIAIGVTVFALWIALEPLKSGESPPAAPIQFANAGGVAWVIARSLGSVMVSPLIEELAFRGYLTRRLMAADFKSVPQGKFSWPSFLVSSSLFGIFHDRWIAGTLAGMLYALALYRRHKLSDAVLAHATTNALIAAYVLAWGKWSLWT